ncbi:hypothetical protein Taro_034897 [Colocasia esculenta]|uniref:Uncharacterized protein n=1 Tax=Colocasia esculenta TaxID=4460 RepID=A0A843VSR8_COLES|nr:hypothetical protein [Colocasia esculenta]
MGDEGLRTQQFVRGLRPELRKALIVARVTDLDAAYQTAAAFEADTLRTRARSAEVQTLTSSRVVCRRPRGLRLPTRPLLLGGRRSQDLGGSFGVIGGRHSRGSSRLGVFSSRQDSLHRRYSVLLLVNVISVTRWVTWHEIVLCYLVCRSSRPSHSLECSSSRLLCSSVSRLEAIDM